MIEHYIDGKSTGIIEPDNDANRRRAEAFIALYNNHYGTRKKVTFVKAR